MKLVFVTAHGPKWSDGTLFMRTYIPKRVTHVKLVTVEVQYVAVRGHDDVESIFCGTRIKVRRIGMGRVGVVL
jgi:hypothetical protein